MTFSRRFFYSSALAGAFLLMGAFGAHAKEGRMYDVCNKADDAGMVAQGLLQTLNSTSLDAFNGRMLKLKAANRCDAQTLLIPPNSPDVFRFEDPEGTNIAFVVIEVMVDGVLRYAVIEENGEVESVASVAPMCEVKNVDQTYMCVAIANCSCPVE